MAAADFWWFIPTPHDAGSPEANHQISPGITHSPSRLSLSDIRRSVRASIGLCIHWPAHPTASPLSAGCSSEQRFASSFLRIPPRDEHPCCSANTSPCRVCRGLTPPSECALPGAPTKKGTRRSGSPFCLLLPIALEREVQRQANVPAHLVQVRLFVLTVDCDRPACGASQGGRVCRRNCVVRCHRAGIERRSVADPAA